MDLPLMLPPFQTSLFAPSALTRVLCIHLPHWPITRRLRRQSARLRRSAVIVGSVGRRRQIVDAADAVLAGGVRIGMSLAEARALYPGVICFEHNPLLDHRALEALGRWLTRFTPTVATGWSAEKNTSSKQAHNDDPPPPVLLLDITGCDRLFGSVAELVKRVRQSVRRFRIPSKTAVAPTTGAAWALASSPLPSGTIVNLADLPQTLRPLPITALRLPKEVVAALHHLGLTTIGQALELPRNALPSRFGSILLLRLDQVIGARSELLVPLSYEVPIAARVELEGPIDALEAVVAIFESLLRQIVDQLARRGHGARQIEIVCRFDRTSRKPDVIHTIRLTSPMRHFQSLFNLLRGASERLDGGSEGFVAFALKVPEHERIADEQIELIKDNVRSDAIEADRLMERLRVRLGDAAVVRPVLVESYLPELAWKPGDEPPPAAASQVPLERSRPLRLLSMPEEIRVLSEPSDALDGRPRQFAWRGGLHRLMVIIGPERIGGEWWRGHYHTRDYYEVENEVGLRFWIFRVVSCVMDASLPDGLRWRTRWFLHGHFE